MPSQTQTTGGRLSLNDAVSWALTSVATRLEPVTSGWKPSLREYVEAAWPVLEADNPFVPGWHIDAICEHLEAVTAGYIRQLLINMPPRHAKSLIVSVLWPTWEWTRHPSTRWLYSSYGSALSVRDSIKCRNIIRSPWYQMRWGTVFQLAGDQNLKTRFDNNRSGYRIATSVGGLATGEGGDRIVVDDPHNVLESRSDTKRESVLTWWDQTMSSRLNNPKTGTRVIVMQRVHEDDLSGHILKAGGYDHLCLPARFESARRSRTSIGWEDPRTEDGQLLWPEHFGEPEVSKLETELGSYAAAGQLQQRPSPASGGMVKRDWWQRYGALPRLVRVEQFVDSAFKDGVGNDYSTCATWGVDGLGNYYVLDVWHDKVEYPDLLRSLHDEHREHLTRAAVVPLIIEDKASGQSAIQSLSRPLPTLSGPPLPALPVIAFPDKTNPIQVEAAKLSKVARLERVTPLIEARRVFLPEDADWVAGFIQEHADFPLGSHDDQVDTTSMALIRLSQQASSSAGAAGGTRPVVSNYKPR